MAVDWDGDGELELILAVKGYAPNCTGGLQCDLQRAFEARTMRPKA